VDKDPVAAARLATARQSLTELSEEWDLPVENLLTPDHLRRLMWRPPTELTAQSVDASLAELGARSWQRRLTVPLLLEAMLHPEEAPAAGAKASAQPLPKEVTGE